MFDEVFPGAGFRVMRGAAHAKANTAMPHIRIMARQRKLVRRDSAIDRRVGELDGMPPEALAWRRTP